MSALPYAVSDTATMLRRSLKHILRYRSMTVQLIGLPVIFLLMFVYVFGGTIGAGLGGPSASRDLYIAYVAPGIILITVAAAIQGTAIFVAMDMTSGIIARLRTMAVSRGAVLTAHVLASAILTLCGVTAVLGVALLLGFRPTAGPVEWLGAVGFLVMITVALATLSVAIGLSAKSVESASNLPTILVLLPFLGSGFVPTDSMPAGLRAFAEYQPFTSFIETQRSLLTGTPIGHNAYLALAWCVVIAVPSYLWAKKSYYRDASR
jgi:ABC-2 type transport system permease protein